jgi:Kef-type K+ transport system membrane component KefB
MMLKDKLALAYVLLIGLPILILFGVLQSGTGLTPSAQDGTLNHAAANAPPAALNLGRLVLQIGVILLASRLTGLLVRKIGQPQVIGEMLAGILLGPSLLGWAMPGISSALFPASSLGYLNAISQVGLVLFMFLVGFSLNPMELREGGRAAVLTSHASIITPFCMGATLALYLYPRLAVGKISFISFALFMGSAMSITAFPVLARILTEKKLLHSRMGTLSIACAAIDDITGWCILAYVVVLIRAEGASMPVWVTIGGAITYVLVMLYGVRPLLPRFDAYFRKAGHLTEGAISLMIVLALASALVTEWLGVHLLFGAFLMGAIMPKTQDFVQTVMQRLESLTVIVLLPLFFAYSGLRTSIGTLKGGMWLYVLLIIAVAVAGKFGGSTLAARMAGMEWRDAASLGILMNTRGLMELVALNIGLDIGVITPSLFTMMVVMALATTVMTSPLLELVYPARLMVVGKESAAQQVA